MYYSVHCTYIGKYISDLKNFIHSSKHIPNSAWLALPPPPLYDKIIHRSETFLRLYGTR
jgi:hypothetical protein